MDTPQPASQPRSSGQRSALVVEDDMTSLNTLAAILRLNGWTVQTAASCAEAMRVLDGGEPFDAVILDLMLPDGSGSDVLERIRREGRPTRVTVTTAASDPAKLDQVKRLNPDGLVMKPINVDRLLKAL